MCHEIYQQIDESKGEITHREFGHKFADEIEILNKLLQVEVIRDRTWDIIEICRPELIKRRQEIKHRIDKTL